MPSGASVKAPDVQIDVQLADSSQLGATGKHGHLKEFPKVVEWDQPQLRLTDTQQRPV